VQLEEGPEPAGLDSGFDPSRRLHQPREFAAVLSARRALRSKHFALHYAASEQGKARLGLVIGRKFLKKAVERNLVKRLARESFRGRRLPDMDLVLRLSAPIGQSGRRELRAELDALLMRLVR
jgi:ribonuclease P protein component